MFENIAVAPDWNFASVYANSSSSPATIRFQYIRGTTKTSSQGENYERWLAHTVHMVVLDKLLCNLRRLVADSWQPEITPVAKKCESLQVTRTTAAGPPGFWGTALSCGSPRTARYRQDQVFPV